MPKHRVGYCDGTILTIGNDLTFIRPVAGGATVHASAMQISRRGLIGLFTVELTLDPGNPDAVVAAGTFSGHGLRSERHDGGR